MSKRIWGATLFVFALSFVIFFTVWYFQRETKTPPGEQHGTELVEMLPAEIPPSRVSASETKRQELPPVEEEDAESAETVSEGFEFLLVNRDNYVAVYQLPENEIYEYTDVVLDMLPKELQQEIKDGKYLKNEAELYNFLENYTS